MSRFALLAVLFVVLFHNLASAQVVTKAVAKMVPTSNGASLGISGNVTFTLLDDGNVTVEANIVSNLPATAEGYAIHVHQYGDRTLVNGSRAGSHYVGGGSVNHNCPTTSERHEGDMGNWMVVSGAIQQAKQLDLLQLNGVNSIVGRAVVMHASYDNCSNPTGFAGSFIAVGVIGITNQANNTAVNEDTSVTSAVSVLQGTSNCAGNCNGTVWFTTASGGVRVVAQVQGLAMDSVHGFHLHVYGDLSSNDGLSVGSHWNPNNVNHGLPESTPRHVGDLGNLQSYDASTGTAYYDYTTSNIPNINSLLGRAVAIHSSKDKGYCFQPVGDAGSRLMVGVIGVAHPSTTPVAVPITVNNVWQDEGNCRGSASSLSAPLISFLRFVEQLF